MGCQIPFPLTKRHHIFLSMASPWNKRDQIVERAPCPACYQTDAIAMTILLSRDLREFRLPLPDVQANVGDERRHIAAVENTRGAFACGSDPDCNPAFLFRCVA